MNSLTGEYEDCLTCGVTWWMPQGIIDARKRDGKNFYCPSGHSQRYIVKPTKYQKRVKELEAMLERSRERVREVADSRNDMISTKNELAYALKVCPFGCGWVAPRRLAFIPDEDELNRYLDRVGGDLAQHLHDGHGAQIKVQKLLEAGA